jgi:hypothetical protein
MFYKTDNMPNDELSKDILLIINFLEKCPLVVKEISTDLTMMTLDVTDKMYLNLEEIMASTFEFLVNSKRDFKIESVTSPKELYKKLNENGLTGESLYAKLKVLDWLWEKAQKLFNDIRGGKFYHLFNALINQLKSILKSILNAQGFPFDIFDEAFDLLNSFLPLCDTELQNM